MYTSREAFSLCERPLKQEKCQNMQLPWDLVAAVQKRLRVWRLEMQDEAELLLEKGELHYQLEEPNGCELYNDVSIISRRHVYIILYYVICFSLFYYK